MDVGARREVIDVVDSITKTTGLCLEPSLLKSLKRLARSSDDNVQTIYDSLKEKLKKNHAQVRFLAVQVVDELFMRSKFFRNLLVPMLETFLQLTVGYKSDFPLPPPSDRALVLREKAIECVEKWNVAYGFHYWAVTLGYRYLKDTLRYKFPNIRERRAAEKEQRRQKEERVRKLLLAKFEKLRDSFPELRAEIDSSLQQLDECFHILEVSAHEREVRAPANGVGSIDVADGTTEAKNVFDGLFEDEDDELARGVAGEAFGSRALRHAALQMEAEEQCNQAAEANSAVFETLQGLLKIVVGRQIPALQEWLIILSRVDAQDSTTVEGLLKQVIDLRNQMLQAKAKCEDLGLRAEVGSKSLTDLADSAGLGFGIGEDEIMDDVEWETGPVRTSSPAGPAVADRSFVNFLEDEIVEADVGLTPGNMNQARQVPKEESKYVQSVSRHKPESSRREVKKETAELLDQAPVIPWGRYLDHWGDDDNVPVDNRGLAVDNHWGPVDKEAVLPADMVRGLNLRASYYQPQALPNRPCRAPLKNGALCQRRDFVKCPMHGPIVPRDELGQVIASKVEVAGADDMRKLKALGKRKVDEDEILEDRVADAGTSRSELHGASLVSPGGGSSRGKVLGGVGSGLSTAKDGPGREIGMEELPALHQEVARQALANVQKKRKEEEKQGVQKRQRGLDVRQHNAAVLRQAAMAGTAQGLAEVVGLDLEGGPREIEEGRGRMGRGGGLTAMLKKKETSKDRLARRLLNGRVREGGIQQIDREDERRRRDSNVNRW